MTNHAHGRTSPGAPEDLRRWRTSENFIWVPESLRAIVRADGRTLEATLILAWGWLAKPHLPFPQTVEFIPFELGRYFNNPARAGAHRWVTRLEEEGLIEVIDRRFQNRQIVATARIFDPAAIMRDQQRAKRKTKKPK